MPELFSSRERCQFASSFVYWRARPSGLLHAANWETKYCGFAGEDRPGPNEYTVTWTQRVALQSHGRGCSLRPLASPTTSIVCSSQQESCILSIKHITAQASNRHNFQIMPPHSIAELSLRHLPDLSLSHLPDVSDNSFQIPAAASTDYLLAEPSNDFLADEDTIDTSAVPTGTLDDIHLRESTSRPNTHETANSAPEEKLTIHMVSRPSKTKSKAKPMEVREASTSAPHLATKAESGIRPDKNTSPTGQAHPRVDRPVKKADGDKLGPTRGSTVGHSGVREGSSTSGRGDSPVARTTNPAARALDVPDASLPEKGASQDVKVERESVLPAQRQTESANRELLDLSLADVTMDAAIGGAAGRLLMYSQSVMPVTRIGAQSTVSTAAHVPTTTTSPITRDDPLTLTEPSPRKEEAGSPQEPISPMRLSRKRPASPEPALDSSEPRKREKRSRPAKSQLKSKTATLNSSREKTRKPRAARDHKPSNQKENLSASGSRKEVGNEPYQVRRSARQLDKQARKENDCQTSGSGLGLLPIADRPNNLPPASKPTRPIEFHFKSELRLDVRKAQHEENPKSTLKRSASRYVNPIPDFKAGQATLAARRERPTRLVPVPFEFSTTIRAREREKFEEGRRAREQELQRQMEERRRVKEMEEEKEIQELRRRAVPKANPVPDWYADAPKKKGGSVKS
ncbi:hypothetical protein OE88DRAFT_60105 [Heliocybe sulcata]|uniref:TPX2 C-terminal domain-containing protein n=1 Tax=Heliocybe sulcata TaxID=5364 RepID=A0A5C3NGD8_9AGAM|nr:hypothetical protein OE88DRAFT_60105 [Heliocybe sulcata]